MKDSALTTTEPSTQHPVTIIVTGANGQLGKCIKDIENQYPTLNIIYTDYQDLDIGDFNQVQSFFKDNTIHYCINCAAYTAVDKAEAEPEKAFGINALGPKNLALACKEHQVVLIHISTDFVFDGNKKEPYKEIDVPNPISVYGASKLQGEFEIQNILKEHFIIRTSWLYSEHGHNFMKTMLQLGEIKNDLRVVNDQIGTPTYAGDLAEVVLNIITTKKMEYGLYHYSNGGEVSWYGFAKAIFELSGRNVQVHPITTKEYPTAAKRPPYSVLNTTKIKQQIKTPDEGWKTRLEIVLTDLVGK